MKVKAPILLLPLALTGCLTNPPQMPILTCNGECTYYGPPQENPNVAMAKVLTGGAVKLGLGLANASVLKSALDGGGSNDSTYIERTTKETSVTDKQYTDLVDRSVSDTSVSSSNTSTSVSDTSVSDFSTVGP